MRRSLTLLELVVVLAVVMVLTALALPGFRHAQLNARRSELAVNLEGVREAEIAYHLTFDFYLQLAPNPVSSPGKGQRVWQTGTAFDSLGFRPDGALYASYQVFFPGTGWTPVCNWSEGSPLSVGFEAGADMNLDGDGHTASYVADAERRGRFCMCIEHVAFEGGESRVY